MSMHLQHPEDPQRHTTQMLREAVAAGTQIFDAAMAAAHRAYRQWANQPKPQDLDVQLSKNATHQALEKAEAPSTEVQLSEDATHQALQEKVQIPSTEVRLFEGATHQALEKTEALNTEVRRSLGATHQVLPVTAAAPKPHSSTIYLKAEEDRQIARRLLTEGVDFDATVKQIGDAKIEQGYSPETALGYAQLTARYAQFQVKQDQSSPSQQISRQRSQEIVLNQ